MRQRDNKSSPLLWAAAAMAALAFAVAVPAGDVKDLHGVNEASPNDDPVILPPGENPKEPPGDSGGSGEEVLACPGDITNDGVVNVFDLIELFMHWGSDCTGICLADCNGDGHVGTMDLIDVITHWGQCQ